MIGFERPVERLSFGVGPLASLRVLWAVGVSGGRCVLAFVATVVGLLVVCGAPSALAVVPLEAPEVVVEGVPHATTATFLGTLNPNASEPSEEGTYVFMYRKGAKCEGGLETAPGLAFGGAPEPLPAETVSSLVQDSEYTVCLSETNLAKSRTVKSAPVHFTTALAPETPTQAVVSSFTATTATFEGQLNPHAAGPKGSFQFVYRVSASECEGESSSGGAAAGSKEETVVTHVTGLQPGVQYTVCLRAENEAGETATGASAAFTTPEAPPAIEAESAVNVNSSEVTLEGVVNPDNQVSECHFQYGTASVTENTVGCKPELLKGFGGQNVSSTRLNEQGQTVESISGLAEGTSYKYRIIATNGKGEQTTGAEQEFTTAETPETGQAQPVGSTTATLNGTLNPNHSFEAGSYEFLYKQSASECELSEQEREQAKQEEEQGKEPAAKQLRTPEPPAPTAGNTPERVSAQATGLLPGTTYTYCLLERNASGTQASLSIPLSFTTQPAPPTAEVSVTDVKDTSATLQARINPGGTTTSYIFEYQAPGGPFAPVPAGQGRLEGASPFTVTTHLQDLNPHTEYAVRVVTTNTVEAITTGTTTFTTQTTGTPFTLPDGRQWEMVSPLQKQGALLGVPRGFLIQAAANGEAFSDWAFSSPLEGHAASNYGFAVQDFFGRGSQGWVSKTITSPHSAPALVPTGTGSEYPFFSADLSKAILQPFGQFTPLVPGVSQQTPYLRTNYLSDGPGQLCETNCYDPLVTSQDVPSDTQYGEEAGGACGRILCGPQVLAATPDLSHLLITSPASLTPGSDGGIYDWTAGQLSFVGQGGLGSVELARHVISDDGSRVFIKGSYEGLEGLLMRDMVTGATVQIDAPQGGLQPVPPGQRSYFETASADGSRVFFLSAEPRSPGHAEGVLYEYDLNAPPGGHLTDISIDQNPGEEPGVQKVLGASENGEYVYFAATGVLAPGATPAGACTPDLCMNLYVRHGGVTTFIAGLSAEDSPDWSEDFPARVSPDGIWLAFMSNRDLTDYSPIDAVSGRPDEEVYVYDTSTGRLACASCDPTGARPSGVEAANALLEGAGPTLPETTWIAASLPGWSLVGHTFEYQSRYLSDDGRLFFDSHDALSPQDVNGTGDTYEFEPAGTGGCGVTQPSFNAKSSGCVSLVSSGESTEESVFLDASETGGDVFFLTNSQLAGQDSDNSYDIYDARECGGAGSRCLAPTPASPPPCSTGDACKPAPSPQPTIFGSPASATFSGAGNVSPPPSPKAMGKTLTRAQKLAEALKACRTKKKKKKRARCEASARKRYGAAKTSTHHKESTHHKGSR